MLPQRRIITAGVAAIATVWLWGTVALRAQQEDSRTNRRADSAQGAETDDSRPVVIQREPLQLTDPARYKTSLHLSPIRTVRLAAPVAAVVRSLHVKQGQRIDAQAEAIQLDDTEQKLLLTKARAKYRAAQIRAKPSYTKDDVDLVELAEAELEAAKAELDLAEHRLEQMSVRAPFGGTVFRIEVAEGQIVQPGDVLAVIGDTSQLKVEVPVDRKEIEPGKTISLRSEDAAVDAKAESVLPLDSRFEPLRDLVPSIASAVAVVDNSNGRLHAGQTIYSPLIPRYPVVEISTASVSNMPGGLRKVQVVRDNVIRDVQVDLLGQVGVDRLFVSGRFAENDEVIVSASQQLPDGTLIRPQTRAPSPGDSSSSDRSRTQISSPTRSETSRTKSGF